MVRLNIPKLSGIYKIQSIVNGKIYVGSAVNLHNRKKDHFNGLKKNKHGNGYLQNHTNKYGLNDLEFHVIEFCLIENLINREQYHIDTLHLFDENKKPLGFNLSPTAGSNLGVTFSKETCEKISNSQKGKIITPEQRQQTSQTLMGNIPWNKGLTGVMPIPWNKGTEGVMIAWNTGKKATPEAIQHQSDSHKGIKQSEEQKHNKSVNMKEYFVEHEHWNVGYHHTEDSKQAIREYQKGRKKSKESVRNSAIGRQKITLQYDLDGGLIGIYESRMEAAKAIGKSGGYLASCISGKCKTAGGFIWKIAA